MHPLEDPKIEERVSHEATAVCGASVGINQHDWAWAACSQDARFGNTTSAPHTVDPLGSKAPMRHATGPSCPP